VHCWAPRFRPPGKHPGMRPPPFVSSQKPTVGTVEMPLLALKLLHVALVFGFVAGLIGRFLLLRRASRAADLETAYETQTAHLPSCLARRCALKGSGRLQLQGGETFVPPVCREDTG
jgi:hypothetical protein